MKYFISAIGTDSGKTFISAILCKALGAAYWKPIQAGRPTDSDQIAEWLGPDQVVHPERYLLNTPESPHAAAERQGIHIQLGDFELPKSKNLIVEGAGGLLVPISNTDTVADLLVHLNLPLILVSDLYLGSINHTLLSLHYLTTKQIDVAGVVFNGEENKESMDVISKNCPFPILGHVNREEIITTAIIDKYARQFREKLS